MIQGIRAAGALLWQFSMVTHLKNWSHLEFFFWHGKCFTLLSAGWFSSITVPKNVAQQTQNLLQMFVWEMLNHPHTFWIWHQQVLSVSHIEGALFMTLFHLWWSCQIHYHHVADTKGTYVLCIWDRQTCLTLSCQGKSVEKYPATGTFILYCQLPLVKSFLWFVGTVNVVSDPPLYMALSKLPPKCGSYSLSHWHLLVYCLIVHW